MIFASRTALALLAAAGLFTGGCSASGRHPGNAAGEAVGTETAAMAATLRLMFADNASGLGTNAAAYCIGIGRHPDLRDPGAELLAALVGTRPEVTPASACRIGTRVLDAAGKPALVFSIRSVSCDGPDNCVVEGGYYEGNLSASSGTYRARRIGGTWRVTPEGPQAVS